MKTTLKRIIAAIFCMVIVITSIGTSTAYAASKPPLKVTFNGKSINMVKTLANGEEESASIDEVLKIFGNPDKKQVNKNDERYTHYTWNKGKSSVGFAHYVDTEYNTDILCFFGVHLQNKNDALCGIKIGMKMDKALKKLEKMFGKKNVSILKTKKNGLMVEKKNPTGNNETISVMAYSYVLPLSFYLKNGRVASMGFNS